MSSSASNRKCTTDESIYYDHKRMCGRRDSQKWNLNELSNFRILVENLNKGAVSKIDLVQHIPTDFVCVMKVFKTNKGLQAEKELDICKQATHSRFLLHCYDSFTTQGIFMPKRILLQYAPFGSLDKLTRFVKGLGSVSLRLYAKEIASALDYLHAREIMHRDIKPENMLLLTSGHVVLADFDVAFHSNHLIPTTNRMCGTHLTRPPEVWEGKMYDKSVDVWMYGISLYNLASNSWPFAHAYIEKQMKAIYKGHPTYPDQYFSNALIDLIEQTIQLESDDRIPTHFITSHSYFKDLDDEAVPFTPSYLLSLVNNEAEKSIIECILQNTAVNDPPTISSSSPPVQCSAEPPIQSPQSPNSANRSSLADVVAVQSISQSRPSSGLSSRQSSDSAFQSEDPTVNSADTSNSYN